MEVWEYVLSSMHYRLSISIKKLTLLLHFYFMNALLCKYRILLAALLYSIFSFMPTCHASTPSDTALLRTLDSITGNKTNTKPLDNCPHFATKNYGQISLGLRAGLCALFDRSNIGYGYGAQVRFRVSTQFNSELFTDYFRTNLLGSSYRSVERLGISFFYYYKKGNVRPLVMHKFTPFFLAGLSADQNYVSSAYSLANSYQVIVYSFDAGYGVHYNITERLDVALEGIYALPIGPYIKTSIITVKGTEYIDPERHSGFPTGGGIYAILSITYCFGNM
jgi:hypothetical protein